jgi:ribose transport system substrate-binding protein
MDLSTQTSQVENFIARQVDAMVICPADSAGIAGAIRKANQAGIPVFTADIEAQGDGKVVSHIASDNIEGGRLAGEYMARMLKDKGDIIIVNYPIVQSVQDRVNGFKEAIAKYPNIKIVDDQAAQGKRDLAVTVTENLLQKHAKLDGIFAINDSSALGALAAVQQSGRKNVVIIGYDGDPEARTKIAEAMKAACANPHIGYDQAQRNTLYAIAKALGFDLGAVDVDAETDCSALVRACCEYAGIHTSIAFVTRNLVAVLLATGAFEQLTDPRYTDQPDYLMPGDILCTRTQGHTVIVIQGGPKAGQTPPTIKLGDRILRKGARGADVAELQTALARLGYKPGAADGDFGLMTQAAVLVYQAAAGLDADGEYGPKSHKALVAALDALDKPTTYRVTVTAYNGAPLTQAQAANLLDEYQTAGYAVEISEV